MSASLSIVIVNWNAGAQLQACLDSVRESVGRLAAGQRLDTLVVVDNASSDGSADRLAVDDLPLRLVRNTENRGFAAGCNQGAAGLESDLLLFLNPDTRLQPDTLRASLDFLGAPGNGSVGILGAQLLDDSGEVSRTCARFPRPLHFLAQAFGLDRVIPSLAHTMWDWDHGETRDVDQVMGAYFLIRRPVFVELGGFDERFFVYFEEVDLALRARRAGHRSVYFTGAQLWHRGGGTTDGIRGRRLFYSLRSRLIYGRKHFSTFDMWILAVVSWVVEPGSRVLKLLATGRFGEIRHVLEAYRLLLEDRAASR